MNPAHPEQQHAPVEPTFWGSRDITATGCGWAIWMRPENKKVAVCQDEPTTDKLLAFLNSESAATAELRAEIEHLGQQNEITSTDWGMDHHRLQETLRNTGMFTVEELEGTGPSETIPDIRALGRMAADRLASLQRRLTEAEAKLAAAEKDTARLDWLESGPIVPFDCSVNPEQPIEWQRAKVTRKSIDAAMSPPPQEMPHA